MIQGRFLFLLLVVLSVLLVSFNVRQLAVYYNNNNENSDSELGLYDPEWQPQRNEEENYSPSEIIKILQDRQRGTTAAPPAVELPVERQQKDKDDKVSKNHSNAEMVDTLPDKKRDTSLPSVEHTVEQQQKDEDDKLSKNNSHSETVNNLKVKPSGTTLSAVEQPVEKPQEVANRPVEQQQEVRDYTDDKLRKNDNHAEMVKIVLQKRGMAPPTVEELPVEQQQEDTDYSDDKLQDVDIVLWSTRESWNLKHQILVTRIDQSNLHERLDNARFRFRRCNDELTVDSSTQKEHLPHCPKTLDSPNNQSMGEQFMSNAQIWIWENKTAVVDINGGRLSEQMSYTSYWSKNRKMHVLLHVGKGAPVKLSGCSHPHCPPLCTRETVPTTKEMDVIPNTTEVGFHHRPPIMWDALDQLCKETRRWSRNGGYCRCQATCHTPAANAVNSTYPWASALERNRFFPDNSKPQKTNRKCLSQRIKQTTPIKAQYACDAVATSGRNSGGTGVAGNLKVTCPLQAAFMHHVFIIPEAKILFSGIPKVGITEWLKFLRFTIGAGDYLSIPHWKGDVIKFGLKSFPLGIASDLYNDPSWTKAVFFRDPAERLLSAYLNKFPGGGGYAQTVFHLGDEKNRTTVTFAEFIDLLESNNTACGNPRGLHTCSDPHWKPQFMTAGLDVLLPLMDFVGSFKHISEHTKLLLERVGAWDTYGRLFDDGSTHNSDGKWRGAICYTPPPPLSENSTIKVWGFNQRKPQHTQGHSTGSKKKLDKFYTPELMARVRKLYDVDFAIWDEISNRSVSDVARGRDLKHVQSYCRQRGIDISTTST